MPRAKKTTWTAAQLRAVNTQQKGKLSGALQALGLDQRLARKKGGDKPEVQDQQTTASKTKDKSKNSKKTQSDTVAANAIVKKKRQGVSTQPIYTSLDLALPQAQWGDNWIAINIPGGRVLTYNELFSILQFRKFEAFKYKKICRNVIKRALAAPCDHKRPFFDGPTRLTLVRIGKKEMDRDALPIVFKYFLDSLKMEGVIDDDNPNIIVDIVTHQSTGEPSLSMRLDRLDDWQAPKVPTWEDLIGDTRTTKTKTKAQKNKK